MAKLFNVYKGELKVVDAKPSPVTITGLTKGTDYPKGAYTATSIEGAKESEKVDLPAFRTKNPVQTITAKNTSMSVEVGNSIQIIMTHTPADADSFEYTYTSEDPTTVAVDTAGTMTGLKEGVVIVTVAVKTDPSIKSEVRVTVDPETVPKPVTSISGTINGEVGQSTEGYTGSSFQLGVLGLPVDHDPFEVKFVSDNPSMLMVNERTGYASIAYAPMGQATDAHVMATVVGNESISTMFTITCWGMG